MILPVVLLLFLLMIFGAPLFTILGGLGLYLLSASRIDSTAMMIELHRIATTPILVAIPLFTFAGYLLSESGAPKRLIRLTDAILGWLPGGLSIIALVTCAAFTALTGATGFTIIAIGGILFPALLRGKYPETFSLGLLTTSGTLGLLFPPSLPLIIYAIIAKVRIDQLFLAGILPGILLVALLSLYSVLKSIQVQVPRTSFQAQEVWRAVREIIWELPLPVVVIGGVFSGYFAVSEAASVTAIYVLIVEVVLYRDVRWRDLPGIMRKSIILVGGILVILGSAMGLTNYLINEEIPMKMFNLIKGHISSPLVFLMVLNLFLLAVGCLMDIFSAMTVVIPLITPIAAAYDIHPIHLGIIFLTNLEIGAQTPPVGVNLFISSLRFEKPIIRIVLASLPFIALLLLALTLVTYIPWLSLALVR